MDARYLLDGSVDYNDFWTDAHHRRLQRDREPVTVRPAPPRLVSPARRRIRVFAAAFAVATTAFWATMATMPPTTEAGSAPLSSATAEAH